MRNKLLVYKYIIKIIMYEGAQLHSPVKTHLNSLAETQLHSLAIKTISN